MSARFDADYFSSESHFHRPTRRGRRASGYKRPSNAMAGRRLETLNHIVSKVEKKLIALLWNI